MTGTVNLYNVYYGDFSSTPSDRTTRGLVDYFSAHIGNTSWSAVLSSFFQYQNGIYSPAATSISFRGSASYEPTAKGITISKNDVIQAIVTNIQNRNFNNGIPDPHGIYVVIFRGDFSWDSASDGINWNSDSLTDSCGFHTTFAFSVNTTTIIILKVIVVGDPSIEDGSLNIGCVFSLPPTANGNVGADNLLVTYAQQIAGTITNYNHDSWYTEVNDWEPEVADSCDFGTAAKFNLQVGTKRFLVPPLYIPGKGCRMSLKGRIVPALIE